MAKQKFKGKTLYTKTMVDNILQMASKGDQKDSVWYKDANIYADSLAYLYKVPVGKVIGIIAALSPMKYWDQNKRLTIAYLNGKRGGTYYYLVNKCDQIMSSDGSDAEILDILNGQKISAFYLNIKHYDKTTAVTVDRHAIEIAIGGIVTDHTMSAKQYSFFQNAYLIAAERSGMLPHELQAVTWVVWRSVKHEDVPF